MQKNGMFSGTKSKKEAENKKQDNAGMKIFFITLI